MELLPAQRDTRIQQRRGEVDERALSAHDAAIIVCPQETAEKTLATLPFAAMWQRLYRHARKAGPVRQLLAHAAPNATPILVCFTKSSSSAFERLSAAGRAWKALGAPIDARVLLATVDLEAEPSAQWLEALLAAVLAGPAEIGRAHV